MGSTLAGGFNNELPSTSCDTCLCAQHVHCTSLHFIGDRCHCGSSLRTRRCAQPKLGTHTHDTNHGWSTLPRSEANQTTSTFGPNNLLWRRDATYRQKHFCR